MRGCGDVGVVVFAGAGDFAGALFAGDFFAGDFFATAFFVGVFFAGDFFAAFFVAAFFFFGAAREAVAGATRWEAEVRGFAVADFFALGAVVADFAFEPVA